MSTLAVTTVVGTQQVKKFLDKGTLSGPLGINPLADGGDILFTMSGNVTVSFTTSGIASGQSVVCSIQVKGAFTVNWPGGIFWPGGTVPAYTDNSIYTFQFRNNAGAMQIFGFQSGAGMAAV